MIIMNLSKSIYLIFSFILISAIAVHSTNDIFNGGLLSKIGLRAFYGFVTTTLVLFFCYYFLFQRKHTTDILEIFKPIFYFNLTIILLFYYSGFEFGLPINDFKVGFTYGNFWDFYFQALTAAEKTYQAINTGYLPFSYALSKIFAKLAGWKVGVHPISPKMIAIYTVYIAVCLSPLIVFARQIIRAHNFNKDQIFFFSLFLATSYPILFIVERGNFAAISFFFLSLAMLAYCKDDYRRTAVFAGFLIALKTMNIVYLIFVIRHCRQHWKAFLITFSLATLISLIILHGFHFERWATFKYAITSPLGGIMPSAVNQVFVMTDGGKLQGGSSFEAFRVLISALLSSIQLNRTTDIPSLNLFMLGLGACVMVLFYIKRIKQMDWLDEIIVLTIIPILFHAQAAEYNLMLLLPALMLIASRHIDEFSDSLLRFASLFIMLSGGLVIFLIDQAVIPNPEGRFNSVTVKSFLVPYSLIGILITIFNKKRSISV
ncbi:hypothetical protein [Methylomonas rosea]|uniref:DUF2029 domain-containing protein n=1 Tax=Methylomonas rosea TaxID=2952227 RepID=A0ABT1TYW7_9GAMM|nr:hypothetical protein [Methylomonas sp. WSC-7]MCQ8119783.1 hypothetical protein [Methylomonas sp. WSC-7]